jgi:hypothetical protein
MLEEIFKISPALEDNNPTYIGNPAEGGPDIEREHQFAMGTTIWSTSG